MQSDFLSICKNIVICLKYCHYMKTKVLLLSSCNAHNKINIRIYPIKFVCLIKIMDRSNFTKYSLIIINIFQIIMYVFQINSIKFFSVQKLFLIF